MLPPRPVAEVTVIIKALPLVLLNFKQPVNVVVYRMLLFYYVLIGMFFPVYYLLSVDVSQI